MKNGFKKRTAVVITAIMTVILLAFTGCTEAEGDHYDNAIKQEQKYQEYISDAKENDRDTEEQLEEIIEESSEEGSEQVSEVASEVEEPQSKNLTFRKKKDLEDHYQKHGIEMGFASPEEYLAAANAVVVNPNALHKKEKEDNDDVYYVEETNEFVVVSYDGYIRTYFWPSAGIDYYNRQ